MNISSIKKYVINLSNRKDRLEHITKEFDYAGWDFIRFDAVDTSSYEGCAYSHIEVAELGIKQNEDYIMVFEDDIFFMPYFKDLFLDCINDLKNIEWDLFHFAPSIHRPINYESGNLVNLSGPHPPKNEGHRGIYGTSAMIYKSTIFGEIKKWLGHEDYDNPAKQKPIDVFFDEYIYPNFKCYCPKAPLVTQIMDHSTVNNGVFNNHYIMTYNWQAYINNKDLPATFNMDHQRCLDFRNGLQ